MDNHGLVVVPTTSALRGDRAELDTDGMARLLPVLQSVPVASNSTKLLPPTIRETARQA
jgi:hypothetical protein